MKIIPWKYSVEKRKFIVDEYKKGRNTKEIANELSTYNTTIRRILISENVPLRSNKEIQSIVKSDLFNVLDGDTNYWLGLIATDGCIHKQNRIIVQLQERDLELLEKYRSWIKYPVNIIKSYSKQFDKVLYAVGFANDSCAKTLHSYGITERKSETIELKIPITRDLLRGIIDGDGSIVSTNDKTAIKVSICTISERFAMQIMEFLLNNGFNCKLNSRIPNQKKDRINKRQYHIILSRKDDVIRLKDFLYKDAKYYLDRKFIKYCELLSNNIVDRVWSRSEISKQGWANKKKQREN